MERIDTNNRFKYLSFFIVRMWPDLPAFNSATYRWEIRSESASTKTGGDAEYVPAVVHGLFPIKTGRTTTFQAPTKPGAYRLFIYVEDGYEHSAHANIPFWVEENK